MGLLVLDGGEIGLWELIDKWGERWRCKSLQTSNNEGCMGKEIIGGMKIECISYQIASNF